MELLAAPFIFIVKVLWTLAKVRIPIPVGVIVIAIALFQLSAYWDKTKAVHDAVASRVNELITGAEKEALKAQRDAAIEVANKQRKIAETLQRQQYGEALARQRFEAIISAREAERAKLQGRINALLARPKSKDCDCTVTPDLYDGMYNR